MFFSVYITKKRIIIILYVTCVAVIPKIRVCYYTSWAQYRQDKGKFVPDDIEPTLCSHIIFAFATMKDNHLIMADWNDDVM